MKTQTTSKTATVKKPSAGSKKTAAQNPPVKSAAAARSKGEKPATNSRPPTEEIAARAYRIWQQQGCPEGREEQHWSQAEQEILGADSNSFGPQS